MEWRFEGQEKQTDKQKYRVITVCASRLAEAAIIVMQHLCSFLQTNPRGPENEVARAGIDSDPASHGPTSFSVMANSFEGMRE